MTLLVETTYPTLQLLDNEDTDRPLRVEGIAAVADEANGNNRVYPRSILEREVGRISGELDSSNHVGMVDHPDWMESVSSIGLKFNKLWMDGRDVRFEAEIVPTQRGKDLEAVIRAGIRIGISSRGEGSEKIESRGGKTVRIIQDDFVLHAYDAVVTPAVANARITRFENQEKVMEALERILDETADNSTKSYINDVDSANTISEKHMERTTNELIKLVKQHLDAQSVVNLHPDHEDAPQREQTFADPSDNPNEQPNPQPDPMNKDTSPLTHTTPNIPDVPISEEGNHPDPTMGDNPIVNPNAEGNDVNSGKMTTQNTGLAALRQALTKDNAETTEVTSLVDALEVAMNRQDEITALKAELADAHSDAGIVAALAALSTSISDHLSSGNWGMVSNLASVASTLSWYAKVSEDGYYDALQKNRAVDNVLSPVVRLAERVVRDEKILELTDGEKYGRTIAAQLRDSTKTASEVEAQFTLVKDAVLRKANVVSDTDTPKGNPITDDKKFTKEQQDLRRLAGLEA